MNLIWRFLWVILFSRFDRPVNFTEKSRTKFRVLPSDVDLLWHMNNGRYFSFMDLARINFMIRCGFFSKLRKQKFYPVIASEMIRFKKSVNLWDRFSITVKLTGWDHRFFYITHEVINSANELCAIALIKARFLTSKDGVQETAQALQVIGIDTPSPQLPDWVHTWNESDKVLHDLTVERHTTQS